MRLAVFICGVFLAVSCSPGSDSGEASSDPASSDRMAVPAENIAASEPDKPLQSVEDIQKAYAVIAAQREARSLDSVVLEYSCNNGEKSGTVAYYSKDGEVNLIVHRYAEYSHYSAEDQYFVRDSMLFFAFLKGVSWSFEEGPEGSTRDNIKEKRIYLLDKKPVRCLEKNYVIRSQIKDNPDPETVPDREVDCGSSGSLLKSFAQLAEYRQNPPPSGCLELD